MQTTASIILAILLTIAVGALIVGLIVWREKRKAAAQVSRAAAIEDDVDAGKVSPTSSGGRGEER